VHACRQLRLVLPARHGTIVVQAGLPGRSERRRVSY
jgi:hypothetical protein